ncbi:efflux RND transporter periplasmic adaptor subunit [Pseudomonas atacamensis]|uniref:Efflux RND transporter periplasmic adaptor subunit n=1 Tax=Pseudomonas atacamensis TaxID=2565368 RepID=A0AAQ2DFK6_9PSED|nr:efflux RND transporter periplasmic adaptor subunit [Pseudomonas atacamensis]THF34517.1 efflux RND transporter periplasmic adaptor subunit [Pseudomonas atacamensis]
MSENYHQYGNSNVEPARDKTSTGIGIENTTSKKKGWRRAALALAILAALFYAGIRSLLSTNDVPPPTALPEVTVSQPIARDVTEWDDYVGRFVASQSVEVRPRVSGQIIARHFKDGEMVKQGQPLFVIDPRPFQAAEAESRAAVASAQSSVKLARSDFARINRLTGDDAVSAGESDKIRAQVQLAEAALAAAQAQLTQRMLDVEWATVRAPTSGLISDRRVDTGNLVTGGPGVAATLLTTINAVDPIYFSFDASEALFLKSRRAQEQSGASTRVQVRLYDELTYTWNGNLDFTDNGLNPRSGTIRGRATIANPQGFLAPGMFGNMRLANSGSKRALLVPDAAVQTDLARKTVLVVDASDTIVAKQVTLGAMVNGLRIIRSGLEATDRVVIAGMQFASPGAKVIARAGEIAPQLTGEIARNAEPVSAQATFTN